ncbi:unnamed protein product [Moneuplotes crassus]|uniref:Uncharacterized protein n=1 Tax=Euplotes crassus TaxID=5936 RepID=A0AAD1X5T8_EUPCR|nr:unnamed protein product [Moneuplotes crassus]
MNSFRNIRDDLVKQHFDQPLVFLLIPSSFPNISQYRFRVMVSSCYCSSTWELFSNFIPFLAMSFY